MLNCKLILTKKHVVHERGLVARAAIRRGEVVWERDPAFPILNQSELRLLCERGSREKYSQVGKNAFARNSPDAWCFNHCCMPNCKGSEGRMVALRDIVVGEEATYDYGLTEVSLRYHFWCQCGGETCRVLVTNWDYLVPKILNSGRKWAACYAKELASKASPSERLRVAAHRMLLLHQQTGHEF